MFETKIHAHQKKTNLNCSGLQFKKIWQCLKMERNEPNDVRAGLATSLAR